MRLIKFPGRSAVTVKMAAVALTAALITAAAPATASSFNGQGVGHFGWKFEQPGWSEQKSRKSDHEFKSKSKSDRKDEKFVQIVKPGFDFGGYKKGKDAHKTHWKGKHEPKTPVAPVPLPAAAWLLIGGMAGLGAVARARCQTPVA